MLVTVGYQLLAEKKQGIFRQGFRQGFTPLLIHQYSFIKMKAMKFINIITKLSNLPIGIGNR